MRLNHWKRNIKISSKKSVKARSRQQKEVGAITTRQFENKKQYSNEIKKVLIQIKNSEGNSDSIHNQI